MADIKRPSSRQVLDEIRRAGRDGIQQKDLAWKIRASHGRGLSSDNLRKHLRAFASVGLIRRELRDATHTFWIACAPTARDVELRHEANLIIRGRIRPRV